MAPRRIGIFLRSEKQSENLVSGELCSCPPRYRFRDCLVAVPPRNAEEGGDGGVAVWRDSCALLPMIHFLPGTLLSFSFSSHDSLLIHILCTRSSLASSLEWRPHSRVWADFSLRSSSMHLHFEVGGDGPSLQSSATPHGDTVSAPQIGCKLPAASHGAARHDDSTLSPFSVLCQCLVVGVVAPTRLRDVRALCLLPVRQRGELSSPPR